MILTNKHINLADYYFEILKNLNSKSKLDLISKLSQSIITEDSEQSSISLQNLFGAYTGSETADEIIKEIRESKSFNRNIELL